VIQTIQSPPSPVHDSKSPLLSYCEKLRHRFSDKRFLSRNGGIHVYFYVSGIEAQILKPLKDQVAFVGDVVTFEATVSRDEAQGKWFHDGQAVDKSER